MNISAITATNFKGLTFEQPLEKQNLFLGPNGAGKSARTQAMLFAIMGYVPGVGKTNADILDALGDGNKLMAGAKIGNYQFNRALVRNGEGKVSMGYSVNGKRFSEALFAQTMGEAKAPKIIDLSIFLKLSDQKKIDYIFDLYPPAGNVEKILDDIAKVQQRISVLKKKAESEEEAAARMTTARSQLQLPPGSLAETDAAINETEEKLATAKEELIREQEAEKQRIKEAEAAAKAQQETATAKTSPAQELPKTRDFGTHIFKDGKLKQSPGKSSEPIAGIPNAMAPTAQCTDSRASIQAILNALNAVGCSTCAARLVAVRELRKFQEVNHG